MDLKYQECAGGRRFFSGNDEWTGMVASPTIPHHSAPGAADGHKAPSNRFVVKAAWFWSRIAAGARAQIQVTNAMKFMKYTTTFYVASLIFPESRFFCI